MLLETRQMVILHRAIKNFSPTKIDEYQILFNLNKPRLFHKLPDIQKGR